VPAVPVGFKKNTTEFRDEHLLVLLHTCCHGGWEGGVGTSPRPKSSLLNKVDKKQKYLSGY
jgi:hypothetical protein